MKTLKIILALALALEPVLFPVAGLYAQDLPSADKDFAQDLQGPSGGDEGGPILDGGSPDAPPPATIARANTVPRARLRDERERLMF